MTYNKIHVLNIFEHNKRIGGNFMEAFLQMSNPISVYVLENENNITPNENNQMHTICHEHMGFVYYVPSDEHGKVDVTR
jgi:hypothetical protein